MDEQNRQRINRRASIKWMLTAAAAASVAEVGTLNFASAAVTAAKGYGSDPKLNEVYNPGDLWPLTFTREQRRTVSILCDLIIPADDRSPSAGQLMVPDFIDEWISAPYPRQQEDRKIVVEGLAWLETESRKRFQNAFADLSEPQRRAVCDDICDAGKAKRSFKSGAAFFAKFRDLTASGFYTTPEGWKDLQYLGNVPLTQFDGPPANVLAYLKLS
jgi:hypothetical protein